MGALLERSRELGGAAVDDLGGGGGRDEVEVEDGGEGEDQERAGAGADEAVVEGDAEAGEADRGEDLPAGGRAGRGGRAEGGAQDHEGGDPEQHHHDHRLEDLGAHPRREEGPTRRNRRGRPVRCGRRYGRPQEPCGHTPPLPEGRGRCPYRPRPWYRRWRPPCWCPARARRGVRRQSEQQHRQQQEAAPADHGVDPAGGEGRCAEQDDHGQRCVGHDRDPVRGRCDAGATPHSPPSPHFRNPHTHRPSPLRAAFPAGNRGDAAG
jgi:hypothetical protein